MFWNVAVVGCPLWSKIYLAMGNWLRWQYLGRYGLFPSLGLKSRRRNVGCPQDISITAAPSVIYFHAGSHYCLQVLKQDKNINNFLFLSACVTTLNPRKSSPPGAGFQVRPSLSPLRPMFKDIMSLVIKTYIQTQQLSNDSLYCF